MKQTIRFLSALLTALLLLPSPAAALSTMPPDPEPLIPKLRDYAPFTDTAGTIAEQSAAVCCETGLMDGVDARHFYPDTGLTHAQIIVISARLHRLLGGEDLTYFEPISLTGADWWKPYAGYLEAEIPSLREEVFYPSLTEFPQGPCLREEFLRMLGAVLDSQEVSLPELRELSAVPDCADPALIRFCRWGILTGKDQYGSIEPMGPLTRQAAAVMLSRLIEPDRRVTMPVTPLDLCRTLFDLDCETVLATAEGETLTLALAAPALGDYLNDYNRSHLMHRDTPWDRADTLLEKFARGVALEKLAEREGVTPDQTQDSIEVFAEGFRGLHAEALEGEERQRLLRAALVEHYGSQEALDTAIEALDIRAEPTEIWKSLDLSEAAARLWSLPGWK